MIYDNSKSGLNTIFRPWEQRILSVLSELDDYAGSREIHERAHESVNSVSRASTINFLEELVKNKYVLIKDATGKGGHRNLYFPKHYPKLLGDVIGKMLIESIQRELIENE